MRTYRGFRPSVALIAVLTALVAACGGQSDGSGLGQDPPDLSGDWRLTSGEGPDGEVPLIDGYNVTLSITDEGWGGVAACNNYGATVAIDGDALTITELYQTEMACLEEAAMESEAAYLAAFGRVTRIDLDGAALVLTDDDGQTTLRYERTPEGEDEATAAGGRS